MQHPNNVFKRDQPHNDLYQFESSSLLYSNDHNCVTQYANAKTFLICLSKALVIGFKFSGRLLSIFCTPVGTPRGAMGFFLSDFKEMNF